MILSLELAQRLHRLTLIGLTAGVVGTAACTAGWVTRPDRFFAAWLTAYFYWLGLALGCLALALLHGISGGGWGRTIRRILEAGYQTLPLLALSFVPIWLGIGRIYEWADSEFVRQHPALLSKAGYLNVSGFQMRAVVYFAVWIAITWVLNRSSPDAEPQLETPRSQRLQQHSGFCGIAYGLTMTLAAVDWVMSLEPEWASTMYGLIHIAGQLVSGLSFAVLIAVTFRGFEPWMRTVTPERLNDLGNLLLAAVMFWAYCSFFQYLVIWSGNLPEENVWYLHRSQHGWQYLVMCLMGLHFVVPFLLLLSRQLKRQSTDLGKIAALLLVMRYADLYWLVVPGFERDGSASQGLMFDWLDVAALVAIGGAWLSVFAWRLSVRATFPLYDPLPMEEADERSAAVAAT